MRMNAVRAIPALLFLAFAIPSQARTINVPADYPTIQLAIDAALTNDVVSVAPGIYHEALLLYTPGIRLDGHGAAILDGTNQSPGMNGITVTADQVTITGFTIQGFQGLEYWGESDACGIYVQHDDTAPFPVNSCTIVCNIIHGNGHGIYMGGSLNSAESSSYHVTGNQVVDNQWYGINIRGAFGDVAITQNAVTGNGLTGIRIDGVDGATVSYNEVAQNGNETNYQVWGPECSGIVVTTLNSIGTVDSHFSYNNIHDNYFAGIASWDDYAVYPNKQIVEYNAVSGNMVGVLLAGLGAQDAGDTRFIVRANLVMGSAYDGINISDAYYCCITANAVLNSGEYGIVLYGYSDNTISYNTVFGSQVTDLVDESYDNSNKWIGNHSGTGYITDTPLFSKGPKKH